MDQVFTNPVAESIDAVDWSSQDYLRLAIGHGRRRLIAYNSLRDAPADAYIQTSLIPRLEQECRVRFNNPAEYNYQVWLDEPGFRPLMHTDGRKPSAIQVYWQPADNPNLGTAFYSTARRDSVLHYFASEPNTGYFMLNNHEPYPDLWHDMLQPVPEATLRLSLYIDFGDYVKL